MTSPFSVMNPSVEEVFNVECTPEDASRKLDDFHLNLNEMERAIPLVARTDWSALCHRRSYWFLRVANVTGNEEEELGHTFASVSWSYACIEFCERQVRSSLREAPNLDSKVKAGFKNRFVGDPLIKRFKDDRGAITHGDFTSGPGAGKLFIDKDVNRQMFNLANLGIHACMMARRLHGVSFREMLRDTVLKEARSLPSKQYKEILETYGRKR